ncbi:E3 ubiquitin-protein ligase [Dictyocoela muelleri]|nr:E3 ubiquitin-protein ligase [Dictyocoela muelleri]
MFSPTNLIRSYQLLTTFKVKSRKIKISQIGIIITLLIKFTEIFAYSFFLFITKDDIRVVPFCFISIIFLISQLYIFREDIRDIDESHDFISSTNKFNLYFGLWNLLGMLIFGEENTYEEIDILGFIKTDIHSSIYNICCFETLSNVMPFIILVVCMIVLFFYPVGLKEVVFPTEKIYDGDCTICFSDYEKDDLISVLTCGHYFHKNCIDEWIDVQQTCPICKTSVNLIERIIGGQDNIQASD